MNISIIKKTRRIPYIVLHRNPLNYVFSHFIKFNTCELDIVQ